MKLCSARNRRISFATFFVVLGLTLWGQAATAQQMFGPTTDSLAMPPAGETVLGFRTRVEIAVESSVSYLPVSILIQPIGTVSADRKLIYRFETVPDGTVPARNGLVVEIPVLLSEGMKQTRLVRYLPKWSAGRSFSVSVLEDGETLPGYAGQFSSVFRGSQLLSTLMPSEFRANVILVDDSSGDLQSVSDALFLNSIGPRFTPSELATDWRSYQRFDMMVMSLATLQQVKQSESCFSAIRSWVMQGGSLIIFEAEDFSAAFQTVNFSNPTDESLDLELLGSLRKSLLGQTVIPGIRLDAEATEPMVQSVASELMLRHVGAGRMLVVKSGTLLSMQQVLTLAGSMANYRISPLLRRGVDPLLGNRRFFEWMIPGVAQPPVYTFIGLLTVFVVLVGPVAYRRTTKLGRGYLMFAIAPVLALVTTVAMFGYGIVADGFGTVGRIRQLTWVDGISGDAAERVRATYFAGIRPAEGLRFASEAEVFAFREGTGITWGDSFTLPPANLGTVELRSGEQRFSSSFLPSRQQRQFVSHQPRFGLGFVKLTPNTAEGKPPLIKNDFNFTLKEIVIRDSAGSAWAAENLSPGQSRPGLRLSDTAASKMLGQMYNKFVPRAEVREQDSQRARNRRDTYDVLSKINDRVDRKLNMTNGIFEFWLQRQMQTLGDIPVSHFVATADVSPDVIAVADCETTESIRYVFGTLR